MTGSNKRAHTSLVLTVQINLKKTETLVQRVLSYVFLTELLRHLSWSDCNESFGLEVLKSHNDFIFFTFRMNQGMYTLWCLKHTHNTEQLSFMPPLPPFLKIILRELSLQCVPTRACQHQTNEKPHCHRWPRHVYSLPCHWLPILLH